VQKKQALKVLTRNIDTGTPEGRLFFHITAAFDEFQRELIVENTKAGLAAARKHGRRGGRPRLLDKENSGIRPEQPSRTMSLYVPLRKRYPRTGDRAVGTGGKNPRDPSEKEPNLQSV
jgi:hypothetical protein